jgi:hypothetical protein
MCVVAVCIVQEVAGRGSVMGICELINGGRPRTFSFQLQGGSFDFKAVVASLVVASALAEGKTVPFIHAECTFNPWSTIAMFLLGLVSRCILPRVSNDVVAGRFANDFLANPPGLVTRDRRHPGEHGQKLSGPGTLPSGTVAV